MHVHHGCYITATRKGFTGVIKKVRGTAEYADYDVRASTLCRHLLRLWPFSYLIVNELWLDVASKYPLHADVISSAKWQGFSDATMQ